MNDSEFDNLLRTAKVNGPLPGSFRQGVWHRIEMAGLESNRDSALFHRFVGALFRSLGATTGVAATIVAGLWLGASSLPDTYSDRLAYVHSISPFTRNHQK